MPLISWLVREDTFKYLLDTALSRALCGLGNQLFLYLYLLLANCIVFGVLVTDLLVKLRPNHTDEEEQQVDPMILEHASYISYVPLCLYYFLTYRNKISIRSLVSRAANHDRITYADSRQQNAYRQSRQPKLKLLRRNSSVVLFLAHLMPLIILGSLFTAFCFSSSDNKSYERYLLLPLGIPYKVDSVWKYFITYLTQAALVIPAATSSLSVTAIYYYLNEAMKIEVDALLSVIDQTDDDDDKFCLPLTTPYYDHLNRKTDRDYRDLLLACYSHHKLIVDFGRDLIRSFEGVSYVSVIVPFLITTMDVYAAIVQADRALLMKQTVTVSVSIFTLFYFCHAGQYLTEINDKFISALYRTLWYERSLEARKFVRQMSIVIDWRMDVSLAPETLVVSYRLFVRTVKTIFSFINFLLQMRRNVR